MKLTRPQLKIVLHALRLAEEWEDTAADSCNVDTPFPEIKKRRQEAMRSAKRFRKLRERLTQPRP